MTAIDDKAQRPGARRPGGRTEQTRLAVARAVLDLLVEGNNEVNISEVAERAGVHRSTLHRRWPTRSALIDEALTLHVARIEVPDTGNFADDIVALARSLATFFSDPTEIALNLALATHADRETDNAHIQNWTALARDLMRPIERAIERGDVQADTNPVVLLNLLIGPLLTSPVFMQSIPEPWFVDELALAVVRAGNPSLQVHERILELIGQRRVMTGHTQWWTPLTSG